MGAAPSVPRSKSRPCGAPTPAWWRHLCRRGPAYQHSSVPSPPTRPPLRPQAAKTYLERQFEGFAGASLDELVKHALHALQASLQASRRAGWSVEGWRTHLLIACLPALRQGGLGYGLLGPDKPALLTRSMATHAHGALRS